MHEFVPIVNYFFIFFVNICSIQNGSLPRIWYFTNILHCCLSNLYNLKPVT
jgi:hypothetical protein